LLNVIRELIDPTNTEFIKQEALARRPEKAVRTASPPRPFPVAPQSKPEQPSLASDIEFRAKAKKDFLQNAPATCAALHNAFRAFTRAQNNSEREAELQSLYRKVHFLAASAGLAGFISIARMASVFEAMLFEITNKPALEAPSMRRTIAQAVDFFDALFQHAATSGDASPGAEILVVDDDALSNHVIVSALQHAQLNASSTQDPLVALKWLGERKFDLVLMDIEMPGMDGFELCKRLRQLPGYRKTPVIYVTSHSDFESRAKSALSGGDDLIAKPVFPMELAVKTMTHLLTNQLLAKAA
jgi:CheY-like chemotaxis protein